MAQQPTVLVVDDDQSIRKMLKEVLALEGIPVETATNGREALSFLTGNGSYVVLLDLSMPVMNGYELMKELEDHPTDRARHRIILMSAFSNLEMAHYLEADGSLAKPFHVDQLLRVINSDENVVADLHRSEDLPLRTAIADVDVLASTPVVSLPPHLVIRVQPSSEATSLNQTTAPISPRQSDSQHTITEPVETGAHADVIPTPTSKSTFLDLSSERYLDRHVIETETPRRRRRRRPWDFLRR